MKREVQSPESQALLVTGYIAVIVGAGFLGWSVGTLIAWLVFV